MGRYKEALYKAAGIAFSLAVFAACFWLYGLAMKPIGTSPDWPKLRDQQLRAIDFQMVNEAQKLDVRLKGWQVIRDDETLCEDPYIDGPNRVIVCPTLETNAPKQK